MAHIVTFKDGSVKTFEILKGQDLRNAIFRGKDLSGEDFSGSYLYGADFTKAHLERTNFSGAYLVDAKFTSANLTKANFTNAVLRRADFTGAILLGTNFTDAILRRAILNLVYMPDAILRGATLDNAGWPLGIGSLGVKIDAKIARQLLYHALDAVKGCGDDELIAAVMTDSVVAQANQYHMVQTHEALPLYVPRKAS